MDTKRFCSRAGKALQSASAFARVRNIGNGGEAVASRSNPLVAHALIATLASVLAPSVFAGHRIETDITYVYRPVCTNNYNFPEDPYAGGNGFCYSIQRTTGTPAFATVEETIAYGEAAPWAITPFLGGPTTGYSCTRFVDGYLNDAPGWRPPNYGGAQNLIRNYQRTCQLNVPTIYYDFFA